MISRHQNTPSRGHAYAIIIGVAIALLAALVVFAGIPNSTKFMHTLHKSGHPLVFGLIALLVLSLIAKRTRMAAKPGWVAYLAAFVIAVLIGAATEIAQLFTHRGAAVDDVVSDAVGAIAGLGWHAAIFSGRDETKRVGTRLAFVSAALLATIVALAPLLWCVAAYAVRDANFPVILQSPSSLDMFFVSGDVGNVSIAKLPDDGAQADDSSALKISIDKGRYPGVQISEPYPKWRGYRTLGIDFTNPGRSDLALVIRVHDRTHNGDYADRFNRPVTIGANTRTTILVPLKDVEHGPKGRLLNLDAIANLHIFASRPVTDGAFYVSKIWLQ